MDAATVKVYDRHAADFASRYAQADVTALHRLLLRYLVPGSRVLEIGCGSGRDAAFLAGNGFAVTATDPSPAMLAAARAAVPGLALAARSGQHYPPAIRFVQAAFPLPAGEASPGEGFDAVTALAVAMHIPDLELFEFAFQVRGLLRAGGTFILSASTGRPGLDATGRDPQGRLFRERPADELRLLFERLGFRFVAQHDTTDGLGREPIRWFTLVLRLESTAGDRPVDQIETIINRDKKDATYKLALLRALCDIAQNQHQLARWHPDGTVSVPLGIVAEKWLYYYWPLIDTDEGLLIPQKRGLERRKPIAFRRDLTALARHFRGPGYRGLSDFHAAYQSEGLDPVARQLTDAVLNRIANTIVVGPVTFASQGDFSFVGHRTARQRCHTPEGVVSALGHIHFRADAWREMCLLGHWIGEAIILRWAELTHEISERQVPIAVVLERLLAHPQTERDVHASRELFKALSGLTCVWTNNALSPQRLNVDHVIPFSLWHNNDLWNLVPADGRVNNEKRDRLVARDLLTGSRDRIIACWQVQRSHMPRRFDVELSRTLLGRNQAEPQWEKPAFAALVEAVETLALQRGVERWEPGLAASARQQRRPAASAAPAPVRQDVSEEPGEVWPPAPLPYTELREGEPFYSALPLVAELAAGPLSAGFEAGTLDAWTEFEWVRIPAAVARPRRFVVRVTGDSMEPTLRAGDLVVFEYHRTLREAGRIVIVADFDPGTLAGECAVKRLRAEAGGLWIVSDNPTYPARKLAESAGRYPILGVAVWNLTQGRACK
jgi:phage repressor protein C with HTH and peptisase S24 domain/SAM-dependent methyltransferase